MVKALSCSHCRKPGIGFGVRFRAGTASVLALLGTVFLSACVSPSPPGEVVAITVADIQQGTGEMGAPVRWGGTIANVRNKPQTTVLEVVSRPLLNTGRPKHNDRTHGRFLAEISGFLDPAIVDKGRDISFIGTVVRTEDGQVGEAGYNYPVLSVFDYRVWKKQSEIKDNGHYPHYFMFDRHWHDWPYRRRTGIHGNIVF